ANGERWDSPTPRPQSTSPVNLDRVKGPEKVTPCKIERKAGKGQATKRILQTASPLAITSINSQGDKRSKDATGSLGKQAYLSAPEKTEANQENAVVDEWWTDDDTPFRQFSKVYQSITPGRGNAWAQEIRGKEKKVTSPVQRPGNKRRGPADIDVMSWHLLSYNVENGMSYLRLGQHFHDSSLTHEDRRRLEEMASESGTSGHQQTMERDAFETRIFGHVPVFCTTKLPREHMAELIKDNEIDDGERVYIPWSIIRSDAHDRDTIIKTLTDEDSWPFLGYEIEAIYDFFKKYLRPAQDSIKNEPFTNFVFIVVDEDCINSENDCLLCCDAPDYSNEIGETVLQMKRMPINIAKILLVPLEQLALTPSEAWEDIEADVLSSIPPFTQEQYPGSTVTRDDDRQQVVSPAQGRLNKQRGIILKPGVNDERGWDDDRLAVIFRRDRHLAIQLTYAHRQLEFLSRRDGATISYEVQMGQ
ncbi:MAG: hypothetical protein Q9174_005678, partial [Haloplaca sp. 1 TL-2023]